MAEMDSHREEGRRSEQEAEEERECTLAGADVLVESRDSRMERQKGSQPARVLES